MILVIIGGIVVWLYMARLCARWTIELDYGAPRGTTLIFAALFCWCYGILRMIPRYLEQRGTHQDRLRRVLLGESGWHRKQRLGHEHEARCEDLEMPST